jgi:hypothetical protein
MADRLRKSCSMRSPVRTAPGASVTRELRRTRIDNGILGDIRFDRSDLNQGPVTFSVVKGRRFVVDRVIIARSDLVR